MKTNKLRIIWVDDERDPNKKMPFGMYTWWFHKIPQDFRELCNEKDTPEIVWLKSYQEWLDWCVAVWHVEDDSEYINCFCLDHDLASYVNGKEKTGEDVAYDITDELTISGRKFPYYECHSSNPAGKQNIESIFESYKKVFC